VLKSWAVPKGPSLDPADKRLAMQVEDHPVSYFDFEGIIPEGNYGAGTVMVWDLGTWQPLSPVPVNGKYVPGTETGASAMLAKGDLKFRLTGKRLKGDFALVRMRSRRPGSKGTEWLLIKKHDEYEVPGYDIEQYDSSLLTKRTMAEIGGDVSSAEWKSDRPASRGTLKAPWLAKAVAKLDQKQSTKASPQRPQRNTEGEKREEQRAKAVAKLDQEKGTRESLQRPQGNTEEKKREEQRAKAVAKVDQEKGTRESPQRPQGNTEEKKTRKAKLRAS